MTMPDGRFLPVHPEKGSTQQIFEVLLAEWRGVNIFYPGEPLEDGFSQQLFLRHGTRAFPEMGAEVTHGAGIAIRYYLAFFEGQPEAYEKIVIAENRVEYYGLPLNISSSDVAHGNRNIELADRYDKAIVQAASNHFSVPILHAVSVGYGPSAARDRLSLLGYAKRPGAPDVMDRIFNPEI